MEIIGKGGNIKVFPFVIESKRPLGSQYLNTHCKYITKTLGCNSNVQIGSPRCIFYVVHYSTKSTQKEDRGIDFDRIGKQVIRRIQKEEQKLVSQGLQYAPSTDDDTCFREGLCRFLIGMSVHLSQDVVSAPMAHLLLSQRGSRFNFSHDFQDLLLGQMLNKLNGEEPGDFVLRRKNRSESGDVVLWPDYSVNDYLYRPNAMEDMCFYEFIASCDRIHMSFNKMNNTDHTGMPILQDGEFAFQFDHPGRRYCYLKKSQKLKIPKISMPKGMICDLEELELDQLEPSDNALEKRENYAKVALILFYPYRDKEIFQLDDHSSLWEKFIFLLKESDDSARFWKKGKDILQNMQDNIQCRKCKAPTDKLKESTVSRHDVGD